MRTLENTEEKNSSTRDEILEKYFKEVRRIPMLTQQEEHELLKRSKDGDKMAVEKLVKSNLKFVIRIARQYKHFGIPVNDLINEGNIGLIEAIHHFDSTRETRLITYAVWWIKQYILKAVSGSSGTVCLPSNKYWDFIKIKREQDKFEQLYHRQPDQSELADFSGIDIEEISEFFESNKVADNQSDFFDSEGNEIPVDDGSVVSENHITDKLQNESLHVTLESVMDNLNRYEKEVIVLSFGLGQTTSYTIDEIAGKLGLTKAKTRRLRETGLRRLRHLDVNKDLREFLCA